MSIVTILIALLIVGAVLYLVSLVPIDPVIKQIIRVVAILLVVIWILLELTGKGGFLRL